MRRLELDVLQTAVRRHVVADSAYEAVHPMLTSEQAAAYRAKLSAARELRNVYHACESAANARGEDLYYRLARVLWWHLEALGYPTEIEALARSQSS